IPIRTSIDPFTGRPSFRLSHRPSRSLLTTLPRPATLRSATWKSLTLIAWLISCWTVYSCPAVKCWRHCAITVASRSRRGSSSCTLIVVLQGSAWPSHSERAGEMAHADDHDLAQPAGKRRLPSHRIGVIEPALRERGSVEQHAIDVDQLPAPAGTEFFDHIRKFGMVLLLDQGNAGRGDPSLSQRGGEPTVYTALTCFGR